MPLENEQFADMPFPSSGIDLTRGFGSQTPGSTPVGTNVVLFEPTLDRSRGGSRPMLSPYILPQVPAGPKLIQHLNYVVDPAAEALLDSVDPPGTPIADPSTNPVGSDPTIGADGYPTDPRFRNPGRLIRTGGSGVQINRKKRKTTTTWSFLQSKTKQILSGASGSTVVTVSFDIDATAGHLLVATGHVVFLSSSVTSITDSQGNTWTKAVDSTSGGGSHRSLWYAVAGSTGPNTVSFNITSTFGYQTILAILEYSGNKATGVLDSTNTNTSGVPVTSFSSGLVTISSTNAAVITAFFPRAGTSGIGIFTATSPAIFRCGDFFNDTPVSTGNNYGLDVVDDLNVEDVTDTNLATISLATPYVALSASFNPPA